MNAVGGIDFTTSTRHRVSFCHWHPDFISRLCQNQVENNQAKMMLPKYLSLDEGLRYGYDRNSDMFEIDRECFYSNPNFKSESLQKYIVRTQALNPVPESLNGIILNHFKFPNRRKIFAALTEREKEVVSQFKNEPEVMAMRHSLLQLDKLKLDNITNAEKNEYRGYVTGNNRGGLSRINLLSDNWHNDNPHAAKFFFGFVDWSETKLMIEALFPEVNQSNVNLISEKEDISDFEQILMVLVKFFRAAKDELISLIWNRSCTTIWRYLQKWSPQVGEAGEDLSILDINEAYLLAEKPQGYINQNLDNIACQVDGKVFMMDVYRTSNFKLRAMFADKVDHAGSLVLTWTCPSGLSFEHTYPMTGRSTESRNVELWGSYRGDCMDREFPLFGQENINDEMSIDQPPLLEQVDDHEEMEEDLSQVDNDSEFFQSEVGSLFGSSSDVDEAFETKSEGELKESKDDYNYNSNTTSDDVMPPADMNINIENILQGNIPSNIRGSVEAAIELNLQSNPDVIPDDVDELLLFEVDGVDNRNDLNNLSNDELREKSIDICKMMDDWIEDREQAESNPLGSGGIPKFSLEGIDKFNKILLASGPDGCKQRKIKQLKRHRALNELYETKKLKKCLLAYNLFKMKEYRETLISILEGGATPEGFKVIPSRLQKVPVNWAILADRGFAYDTFHYPNLNHHLTPHFMAGRPQFEIEEIKADRRICALRYTCETCFARVTSLWGLRDVIPYSFFSYLTDMIHWGHANVNFGQPLQKPTDYDSLFV